MNTEGIQALIGESARRLFQRYGHDHRAELSNLASDSGWLALQDAGLPYAMLSETDGGVGLDHAFMVIGLSAAAAMAYPLCETMAANWLLTAAGIGPCGAPLTLVDREVQPRMTDRGLRLIGEFKNVPWGRCCDLVITTRYEDCVYVSRISKADLQVTAGQNVADEPRDRVRFDLPFERHQVHALPTGFPRQASRLLGAAVRTAQIAGAAREALDICVAYAQERRQFGRAIGSFQAVQQLLARMATQAAMASAATDLALDGIRENLREQRIAAAKTTSGEAAGAAASISHQVLGAIGFTREHPLHTLTHRLWSWRDEFGSEGEWSLMLGHQLVSSSGIPFWHRLTAI